MVALKLPSRRRRRQATPRPRAAGAAGIKRVQTRRDMYTTHLRLGRYLFYFFTTPFQRAQFNAAIYENLSTTTCLFMSRSLQRRFFFFLCCSLLSRRLFILHPFISSAFALIPFSRTPICITHILTNLAYIPYYI